MTKDKTLECPRCWVKMNKEEVEVPGPNVIIDVCPKCGGIWLDRGELRKVLGDRKLANYLTKDIGTKSESPLLCPRCGGLMDIERADDIEVDVCLDCNGVWLDAGELEALKDKSSAGFEGDALAKEEERWEEMQRKNRESWLGNLFKKWSR